MPGWSGTRLLSMIMMRSSASNLMMALPTTCEGRHISLPATKRWGATPSAEPVNWGTAKDTPTQKMKAIAGNIDVSYIVR